MSEATNIETLTKAFSALDSVDLENLAYHLKAGTRIFCGKESDNLFTSYIRYGFEEDEDCEDYEEPDWASNDHDWSDLGF